MVSESASVGRKSDSLPNVCARPPPASLESSPQRSDLFVFGSVAHKLEKMRSEGYSQSVIRQLSLSHAQSTNSTYVSK